MTFYTPRPGGASSPTFVFDQGTLDVLKREVKGTGKTRSQADAAVASQFEALFLQMVLKNAHSNPLFKDNPLHSDATRMAQSMQDEQTALALSQSHDGKGLGIGAQLLHQIRERRGITDASSQANARAEADSVRKPGLKSMMALDKPFNSINQLLGVLGVTSGSSSASTDPQTQAGTPAITLTGDSQDFIQALRPAAQKAADKTGVPAALILSQAALESGWGAREITDAQGNPTHNLFGIKATGDWHGRVVQATTTEYINGHARKMSQPFRAYDSYAEAFTDYAKLMSDNPRYEKVVSATTPQQAAHQIQKAGYATDPHYAKKLIGVMAQIALLVGAS